ncbi:hypothetical protein [Salinibacterium sp. ZJ77]|uniref:hypothetical protein n=1 Tax=Salinibacterium sp. ZJ77 TaxID=2708337 RepID=UPI00142309E9|nr:hypothetical protein [Salinibacterium sp. ZJ77]
MTDAASSAQTELQSSAWRRAAGPLTFASLALGLLLQVPVGLMLPEVTRPVLPFVVVAAGVALILGGGLALAFPRAFVDARGAMIVRGRRIEPAEFTSATRSLSSGGAAYLTYVLATADGRRVRILVAGSPVRGLRPGQIRLLRDVVAASAIPATGSSTTQVVAANILASGRKVTVDRSLLLTELDALAPVLDPVDGRAASAGSARAAVRADAYTDLIQELERDDAAARERVRSLPQGRRIARRVTAWLFLAAAAVAAVMMGVLVVMEWGGRDLGAVDDEPLVAVMFVLLLMVLAAGVAWAVAADLVDAQLRRASSEWLATATLAERRRGLPEVFQRPWMMNPGGRVTTLGLYVLATVCLASLIAGPVLAFEEELPPWIGWIVFAAGSLLTVAAVVAWRARASATERRIAWLVEVSGQRVMGPDAG